MRNVVNKNFLCSTFGFSLVEVSLALLVVGVGLLAVFGLFVTGLDTDKASTDDTKMAFFAEEVLNGIIAKSASTSTTWEQTERIEVYPSAIDQWKNPLNLVIRSESEWKTLEYIRDAAKWGVSDSFTEYAMRYRLRIRRMSGEAGDHRAYALLEVLPGQYGPVTNSRKFYIEFPNMKPQ